MASSTWCALSHSHGSCSFLVVVLLALVAVLASPIGAGAAASGVPKWHVVGVSSPLPSASVCTAAKAASNSSVFSVTHRHGPCSPLPLSSSGNQPSPAEILERDQERVASIHRKIVGVSMPARQGWPLGTNNYVMSASLGTLARLLSVEIDSVTCSCLDHDLSIAHLAANA
ncbi:hypothetical protein PR202_ga15480 [Eleusine coracana subsp. coracana]|uniref:Uncharacterized protein n=1 Tax=Eleusine coracana subsp. coracana TaxID=191504 RepID=A0AAV5CJZ8_ELECO|nr:hypothetical protein PR202_ga15480 [Eleusine coracana subsp. coracana]